jgi:sulfate transport system ATP-binding protein
MNKGQVEQIGTPQEVYDNPATPYVYNFLGNVNQFTSHVNKGEVNIADISLKIEAHKNTKDSAALAYIRPHDLEIEKKKRAKIPGLEATVNYIHAIGPLVRLELQQANQPDTIEAELTQERFRELSLSEGERVFVYPRNVRIFLTENNQI